MRESLVTVNDGIEYQDPGHRECFEVVDGPDEDYYEFIM